MDPFTLASGIAGLLSLAIQTLQMTYQYCSSVKHAKEDAVEMSNELDLLKSNLSELHNFLQSPSTLSTSFQYTSVLYAAANICSAKLQKLRNRLNSVEKSQLGPLKWPLSVVDHRTTIQDIRGFAHTFHFALTIDGW